MEQPQPLVVFDNTTRFYICRVCGTHIISLENLLCEEFIALTKTGKKTEWLRDFFFFTSKNVISILIHYDSTKTYNDIYNGKPVRTCVE